MFQRLSVLVEEDGQLRQRRLAIATDSKDEAQALEATLLEHYPNIDCVRIDSSTNVRYIETQETSWSFSGNEPETLKAESNILAEEDNEPETPDLELLSRIETLNGLINQTETQRYLLQFWLDHPEVESLTFEDSYEYNDEGGYSRSIALADISFVNDEAMKVLKRRLDNENFYDDDEETDWEKIIFDCCYPYIEEDLMGTKLTRPAEPKRELAEMITKLREVLLSTATGDLL